MIRRPAPTSAACVKRSVNVNACLHYAWHYRRALSGTRVSPESLLIPSDGELMPHILQVRFTTQKRRQKSGGTAIHIPLFLLLFLFNTSTVSPYRRAEAVCSRQVVASCAARGSLAPRESWRRGRRGRGASSPLAY